MSKIYLIGIFLFSFFFSTAQVAATFTSEEVADGSPSVDMFNDIFEIHNTGNLHIYTSNNVKPTEDYFFDGIEIDEMFYGFLPKKLRSKVIDKKINIEAVCRLKGSRPDDDIYLVQTNSSEKNNVLSFYRMKRKRLKKMRDVAYSYNVAQNKVQLNTWVRDINKDGKLDIIQKRVYHQNSSPSSKNVKTTVYLLNDNMKFKKSKAKTKAIDSAKYQMQ